MHCILHDYLVVKAELRAFGELMRLGDGAGVAVGDTVIQAKGKLGRCPNVWFTARLVARPFTALPSVAFASFGSGGKLVFRGTAHSMATSAEGGFAAFARL